VALTLRLVSTTQSQFLLLLFFRIDGILSKLFNQQILPANAHTEIGVHGVLYGVLDIPNRVKDQRGLIRLEVSLQTGALASLGDGEGHLHEGVSDVPAYSSI